MKDLSNLNARDTATRTFTRPCSRQLEEQEPQTSCCITMGADSLSTSNSNLNMGQPYIKFYIGDYQKDTKHLSCEEHGAYLQLLFYAYSHAGKIPKKVSRMALTCSLSAKKWHKISAILEPFFEVTETHWISKRVVAELDRSNYYRGIGRAGGQASTVKRRLEQLDQPSEPEPEPEGTSARALPGLIFNRVPEPTPPPLAARNARFKPSAASEGETVNHPSLRDAIAYWERLGAYSEDEVKQAYSAFQASTDSEGNWYWGKRLVTDWRAAMETRLGQTRDRNPNANTAKSADRLLREIQRA